MKKQIASASFGLLIATAAFAAGPPRPSSSLPGRAAHGSAVVTPATYGTGTIAAYYSAAAFEERDSTSGYQEDSGDKILTVLGGSFEGGDFAAQINLPAGAFLESVDVFYCDNDAINDMTMFITRYDTVAGGYNDLAFFVSSGTPGCGTASMAPGIPETVNNNNFAYNVIVRFAAASLDLSFRGARVYYHLQVSPSPPVPTFNDVPATDFGYQYIEALAASAITGGCGGGNYCPDSPVTRRQMGIFIAKALGLHWGP